MITDTAKDMAFSAARDQVATWKSEEAKRFSLALVQTGLDLYERGVPYVGPDDVPEDCMPHGSRVAGCEVARLLNAHVIDPFFGTVPEDGVHGGRRRSKRPSRNAAKVCLYKLRSLSVAEAFLMRHGRVARERQMVMAGMG